MLAELAKEARVFDVVAAALARTGRGRYPALFAVCFGFAAVSTIFLNLDTTAVLLTPVLLAMAGRAGIPGLPMAMTTVWLANTASLLLPVSNLTNLLAADRLELPPLEFAARMWLPQVVILAFTAAFLWIFYWRRHPRSYTLPERVEIGDPVVFRVLAAACLAFALAVLGGVPIEVAAVVSAVVAVGVFAWRDRERLSLALIPWGLLVFVTGLFLVVGALEARGVLDGDRGRRPVRRRGPGRRARERGQQSARLRRGRAGAAAGGHRGHPRAAHRHQRRDDRDAVGVAGHVAVVRAVPPVRAAGAGREVHGDRVGAGGLLCGVRGAGAGLTTENGSRPAEAVPRTEVVRNQPRRWAIWWRPLLRACSAAPRSPLRGP